MALGEIGRDGAPSAEGRRKLMLDEAEDGAGAGAVRGGEIRRHAGLDGDLRECGAVGGGGGELGIQVVEKLVAAVAPGRSTLLNCQW